MIKGAKSIIEITFFSFSGCNIYPELNYVVFDRKKLTVGTESDKYFIEEIELAEYIKEERKVR
ncbi:hypothetical protein EFA69_13515 [Rufibacter immobilis]|uniref:Uncharacterized protein n=1 Tax=Rufibacter immobilis TaxID=1348778 RepID=A0A3M9MNS7_9BACT|nr:hypothetical protein [Rufibacter immobilis]RNI27180.1 hypothetical protein EFA69_13515 [Rufibacter immobilis]